MADHPNQKPETEESIASADLIDSQLEDRLTDGRLHVSEFDAAPKSLDPEMAIDCLTSDPSMAQLVMRNEIEGRTYMTVYQKLNFSAEQQTQVIHIPFAPPLQDLPEIEATLDDEVNARLRITDRQKFGIRLEVVLSVEDAQPIQKTLIVNVA